MGVFRRVTDKRPLFAYWVGVYVIKFLFYKFICPAKFHIEGRFVNLM